MQACISLVHNNTIPEFIAKKGQDDPQHPYKVKLELALCLFMQLLLEFTDSLHAWTVSVHC